MVGGNANISLNHKQKQTHRNEDNKMATFVFGPMLRLSQKTSMHDWGAWFWTNIWQIMQDVLICNVAHKGKIYIDTTVL